jgi:hypothetical protein
MFKWVIFNAVLFYVCLPGMFFTVGGKQAALVHAVVFAVAHHCLSKVVMREFFDNPNTNVNDKCPPGFKNSLAGDCVSATDKANAVE